MASKSAHILLAVLSFLAVAVLILASSESLLVGNWTPLKDPNAPEVVEIAKFALTEYNKEKQSSLVIVKVVRGETQMAAGTYYRLEIIAVDAAAATIPKTYTALVYQGLDKKSLNLISFA